MQQDNIKVSVLTPIYNHSLIYVRQCLDSLKAQTLQEIEFILIDNGAPDEAKQLIEEYKNLDERFRILHIEKNQGYGYAMNLGLEAAKGEYIGIVESDDWIEPEMYEKLYELAETNHAEIILSQIYEFYNNRNIYKCKYSKNFFNKLIESSDELKEQAISKRAQHWANIYKNNLLKEYNIKFNTEIYSSPDIGFLYQSILSANSIFVTPHAYIHYRMDNPNSSIQEKDFVAKKVLNEYEYITTFLEKIDAKQDVWDVTIYNEYLSCMGSIYNRFNSLSQKKLNYIKIVSKIFRKHIANKKITFKKFSKKDKKTFYTIAYHPVTFYLKTIIEDKKASMNGETKTIKFLGGIIKRKYTPTAHKYYIFGIQFYKKRNKKSQKTSPFKFIQSTKIDNLKKIKILGFTIYKQVSENQYKNSAEYFKGVFKIITFRKRGEYNRIKKYYLFGIPVFKKHIFDTEQLRQTLNSLIVNTRAAALHPETFGPYKNINLNKDVVLICGGPTVEKFIPIKNAVYVTINDCCKYEHVEFDYLFLQELHPNKNKNTIANNYKKKNGICTKFYGIIPDKRLESLYDIPIKRIPQSHIVADNILQYYLDDKIAGGFTYNLATEPIADYGGTAFSAIQFTLWTNPKRIFIVGADCAPFGHAFSKPVENLSTNWHIAHIKRWKQLKQFAEEVYPDVKIYSVNPVGLKGVFEDIFSTNDSSKYINNYNEIFNDIELEEITHAKNDKIANII